MRKLLLIAGMLCLYLSGHAQSDTTVYLNNVEVTGNRMNIRFSESSRNVNIIDREEIKAMPAQSLPEILSYVPGVDIRQRGPIGVQSDISIRGGSFEQTLVMWNGIKMTDPQTGHHMMNVPINNTVLDRVEVIKGPGARIYGQNAYAGAVNFITRPPSERKVFLNSYYGTFNSYGATAGISLPVGSLKQYASVGFDKSDGYRYNTDYDIQNLFYQAELAAGPGQLQVLFGHTDRNFGANGFYASPVYTDQYEEVTTTVSSISYQYQSNNWQVTPRVSWRRNRDFYLFIRNNPEAYENLHLTNTLSLELNAYNENKLGRTGVGIEYRDENIEGDWVRGGERTKSNLDGFSRSNIGVFLEHRFQLGQGFDITPGIYVADFSDFGTQSFPGIDIGYQINNALRIYGNIGKSFRIPTFYDQYYESPAEQGDPNLQPENAMTYEIGGRYLLNKTIIEVNAFYRDNNALIDWVLNNEDSVWYAQNFSEVKTYGLEFSAQRIFEPASWIQRIQFSGNFLNQSLADQEVTSRYSLEHIRHQLILNVHHKLFAGIKNDLRIRYIDRVGQAPYWLVDDRIYYQKDQFQIFVEVTNLLNTSYTEVMTPMPGRWFRAGLQLNLEF